MESSPQPSAAMVSTDPGPQVWHSLILWTVPVASPLPLAPPWAMLILSVPRLSPAPNGGVTGATRGCFPLFCCRGEQAEPQLATTSLHGELQGAEEAPGLIFSRPNVPAPSAVSPQTLTQLSSLLWTPQCFSCHERPRAGHGLRSGLSSQGWSLPWFCGHTAAAAAASQAVLGLLWALRECSVSSHTPWPAPSSLQPSGTHRSPLGSTLYNSITKPSLVSTNAPEPLQRLQTAGISNPSLLLPCQQQHRWGRTLLPGRAGLLTAEFQTLVSASPSVSGMAVPSLEVTSRDPHGGLCPPWCGTLSSGPPKASPHPHPSKAQGPEWLWQKRFISDCANEVIKRTRVFSLVTLFLIILSHL